MNPMERTGSEVFSLLMRLYPAGFRETFGPEMLGVFEEKMADERRSGPVQRIGLAFRELADLAVRGLVERARVRQGKENPMPNSTRSIRLLAVLSPVLLAFFLAIFNPRYMMRFFSDRLGWEMAGAVLLGLFVGVLAWPVSKPANAGRRFAGDFAVTIIILATDLIIMLGPALVMAFGSGSPIAAGRDYGGMLRGIMLTVVVILAAASAFPGIAKIRAARKKIGA